MTKRKSRPQTMLLTVEIDRQMYRGLKFEARLLNKVFGCRLTPEGVARLRLERAR
jgi:hypothetical protein